MGQRLGIYFTEADSERAQLYFHWGAFTSTALDYLSTLIETEKDLIKEDRYIKEDVYGKIALIVRRAFGDVLVDCGGWFEGEKYFVGNRSGNIIKPYDKVISGELSYGDFTLPEYAIYFDVLTRRFKFRVFHGAEYGKDYTRGEKGFVRNVKDVVGDFMFGGMRFENFGSFYNEILYCISNKYNIACVDRETGEDVFYEII